MSATCRQDAEDRLRDDRLAGAAFADQGDRPAARDAEGHALDHLEARPEGPNADPQILDAQKVGATLPLLPRRLPSRSPRLANVPMPCRAAKIARFRAKLNSRPASAASALRGTRNPKDVSIRPPGAASPSLRSDRRRRAVDAGLARRDRPIDDGRGRVAHCAGPCVTPSRDGATFPKSLLRPRRAQRFHRPVPGPSPPRRPGAARVFMAVSLPASSIFAECLLPEIRIYARGLRRSPCSPPSGRRSPRRGQPVLDEIDRLQIVVDHCFGGVRLKTRHRRRELLGGLRGRILRTGPLPHSGVGSAHVGFPSNDVAPPGARDRQC